MKYSQKSLIPGDLLTALVMSHAVWNISLEVVRIITLGLSIYGKNETFGIQASNGMFQGHCPALIAAACFSASMSATSQLVLLPVKNTR